MPLHLVVPGLLWPDSRPPQALATLKLPGLMQLLGQHAAQALAAPDNAAAAMAAAFAQACGLPALGPALLRRAGEDALPAPEAGSHWLCADPVHLRFAREHLLLTEADDAQALTPAACLALRELFAAHGQFEAASPGRAYLKLTRPGSTRFAALEDVLGRPLALFMPEGAEAAQWSRLLNECQVLLHNQPEAGAQSAAFANSLWLWGEGASLERSAAPAPRVFADGLCGRGAARLAGSQAAALTEFSAWLQDAPPSTPAVILSEALHRAAEMKEGNSWCSALTTLEAQVFAPLAAQRRLCQDSRLSVPARQHAWQFELGRPLWALWRRKARASALLAPNTAAKPG